MRSLALIFLLFLLPATAADRDLAGRYDGEWKSNGSGGGGAIHLVLDLSADGVWKWEANFMYAGALVKTVPHELKVNQSKLEGSYDFELQGVTLRSHLTGEYKGKAFEGQYQTTTTDGSTGVDEGTWNAARAK
jgi:hypothetical protein